jgi:hypothetical protein
MVIRTASAVLWFFAAWSLGAAGALYLHTDERLGVVAGVGIAVLILHRELAVVVHAIAIAAASRASVLPQHADDAGRTTT